jgi:hypothetical protein
LSPVFSLSPACRLFPFFPLLVTCSLSSFGLSPVPSLPSAPRFFLSFLFSMPSSLCSSPIPSAPSLLAYSISSLPSATRLFPLNPYVNFCSFKKKLTCYMAG